MDIIVRNISCTDKDTFKQIIEELADLKTKWTNVTLTIENATLNQKK